MAEDKRQMLVQPSSLLFSLQERERERRVRGELKGEGEGVIEKKEMYR